MGPGPALLDHGRAVRGRHVHRFEWFMIPDEITVYGGIIGGVILSFAIPTMQIRNRI